MPPIDNTPPTDNTKPADDLPLAITRAVETVEAREAGNEPPVAPSHPATSQPRNADGQFAPKPAPTPPTDAPSVASQPGPATGAPGAVSPSAPGATGAAPPVDPNSLENAPASWKDGTKAKWATLDNEVRGEIMRRERETDYAMRGAAERARAASAVLDEFMPYQEILQQEGASPVAAIRTLLQTAYALRTSGPEYRKAIFLDLAQQYGVDLTQGINQELAAAQARLAQHDIDGRTSAVMQEQEQVARASAVLSQFAATHEHFEKVRGIMGNLMQAVPGLDLEDAYQRALVFHPDTSKMLIQQEARKLAEAQNTDARRRAAASSVGNTGGFAAGPPGSPQPSNPGNRKDDLRATISDALDRVGGV